MRRLTVTATVLALLLPALGPASSYATPGVPDPVGLLCRFDAIYDPNSDPGTHVGELSGGPLLLTDDETPPGIYSGNLVCTVQVNLPDHTGTGESSSGHGTGIVTAGPSEIVYTAADSDVAYLCGKFTNDADNVTYYFDDTNSVWSTDATVACGLAQSPGSGSGGGDPLEPYVELLDSLICPVLAVLFPPEGDVPPVWDC